LSFRSRIDFFCSKKFSGTIQCREVQNTNFRPTCMPESLFSTWLKFQNWHSTKAPYTRDLRYPKFEISARSKRVIPACMSDKICLFGLPDIELCQKNFGGKKSRFGTEKTQKNLKVFFFFSLSNLKVFFFFSLSNLKVFFFSHFPISRCFFFSPHQFKNASLVRLLANEASRKIFRTSVLRAK